MNRSGTSTCASSIWRNFPAEARLVLRGRPRGNRDWSRGRHVPVRSRGARAQAPNVFELGVAKAFEQVLRPTDCANCWCTLTLGNCYAYDFSSRLLEGRLLSPRSLPPASRSAGERRLRATLRRSESRSDPPLGTRSASCTPAGRALGELAVSASTRCRASRRCRTQFESDENESPRDDLLDEVGRKSR